MDNLVEAYCCSGSINSHPIHATSDFTMLCTYAHDNTTVHVYKVHALTIQTSCASLTLLAELVLAAFQCSRSQQHGEGAREDRSLYDLWAHTTDGIVLQGSAGQSTEYLL